MTETLSNDAICFMGTLPEDPDSTPLHPPHGFIWAVGSSWGGELEIHEIADVKVMHEGDSLEFTMTRADVISLQMLLDQVISSMENCRVIHERAEQSHQDED